MPARKRSGNARRQKNVHPTSSLKISCFSEEASPNDDAILIWPSITLSFFVFMLYQQTMFASIAGGDSPELIAESCIGGVAHPPGYPLLIGLFRLVHFLGTFVGTATPAILSNSLCCFFGSIAAGCIAYIVAYCTGNNTIQEHGAGVTAGALFAFSPLVWEYSTGAEVFALNNMLISILLVLTMWYAETQSLTVACAGAFVCGLGLTNQQTIVLFEGPLILCVLYWGRQRWSGMALFKVALCFLMGLTPYLSTIWASQVPTRGSWGDVTNIEGFLRHVLRQEYGSLTLSPANTMDKEGLYGRLLAYWVHAKSDYLYVGPFLALFGMLHSTSSSFGQATIMSQSIYLLVFNFLANIPLSKPLGRAVFSRFWMQPNVIMCLWMGIGLARLQIPLPTRLPIQSKHLAMTAMVGLVLCQIILNFSTMNHSQTGNILHGYGTTVLQQLPHGAILLSHTDINWNVIRYLQECEGIRKDVTHLSFQMMPYPWFERQHHLYPHIHFPVISKGVSTNRMHWGNTELIMNFVAANVETYDIYIDLHAVNDAEIQSGGGFHGLFMSPVGMVWKMTVESPSYTDWNSASTAFYKASGSLFDIQNADKAPQGSWEYVAASIYWDSVYQRGLYMLDVHIAQSGNITNAQLPAYVDGLEEAVSCLVSVLETVDSNEAVTYPSYDILKNTALAHMRFHMAYMAMAMVSRNKDHRLAQQGSQELQDARHVVERFVLVGVDDPSILAFKSFLETYTQEKLSKEKWFIKSLTTSSINNHHH